MTTAQQQQQQQQQQHQQTSPGRRDFRGGIYRTLLLGLLAYVLVAILIATNATHPVASHWLEDHSTRLLMKEFMEGFSFSSTSLKTQPVNGAVVPETPLLQKGDKTHSRNRSGLSVRKEEVPAPVESVNSFSFPAHGCSVNTKGHERIHCHFQNLRINKTKISAIRMGGEPLHLRMGQDESDEFLSYQKGAFVLQSPLEPSYPSGRQDFYYMNTVHQAIKYESSKNTTTAKCDQVWKGLTLFITRYEYVNLYHTMTDWWNAYFSLPDNKKMTENNTNVEKVNVVFLDAHPEGNLDPVWAELFGKVTFARHLPAENTCFEEARFVPAGYACPLFPRSRSISVSEHAGEFVEHVLNAYDLKDVHRIPGHVVVIERVPYIAHPRSKPHTAQRVLGNIRELAGELPSLFPNVTVEVVTLVNDTMRDQIAAIRRADVLVANHGAGLTHLLFLDAGAHVVELSCQHGFFPELAKWRRDIHHYCQHGVDGRITKQYWEQYVVSVVRAALFGKAS